MTTVTPRNFDLKLQNYSHEIIIITGLQMIIYEW